MTYCDGGLEELFPSLLLEARRREEWRFVLAQLQTVTANGTYKCGEECVLDSAAARGVGLQERFYVLKEDF